MVTLRNPPPSSDTPTSLASSSRGKMLSAILPSWKKTMSPWLADDAESRAFVERARPRQIRDAEREIIDPPLHRTLPRRQIKAPADPRTGSLGRVRGPRRRSAITVQRSVNADILFAEPIPRCRRPARDRPAFLRRQQQTYHAPHLRWRWRRPCALSRTGGPLPCLGRSFDRHKRTKRRTYR